MKNIAIVGFGFMGQLHAQVYARLAGATIAGVVDKRTSNSKIALEKLGIDAPVRGSLGELLEETAVDAVDVCLPTDLHHPVVLEATAAGKHVFCEKPISNNAELAQDMVRAASDAGVQLMAGHCIRFWPEYQAITDFAKSGRGGRLLSLNLQRLGGRPGYTIDNWVGDEERCRGAALDMHIHDTDYIHHLLGKPAAVFSRGVREDAGWNYISTQYLYDEGPVVTAEGGWNLPPNWGFRMTLNAVFENAAIDFDNTRDPTLTLSFGEEPPAPMPFPGLDGQGDAESTGNISDLGGYYNELEYFIAALERDAPVQINTGEDALQSLRTTLAEIESAATGKIVSIS